MKALARTIFTVSIVMTLTACSTVQGVVRDKPTGSPISSATVTVGRASTTTNAFGSYSLQGSWLPRDTMIINAPGYHLQTLTVGAPNAIHDIDLIPK